MPRIPEVTPQVGVRNAPSVRQNISVSPDTFGAATGRALQNLGDVGQNIAVDLQNRRNVVEVQNAYFQAGKALQDYLHNPETGVYTRRGVNAAGSFQEVMDKLPQIAAEYTQNLSGAQRELFERQWRDTSMSVMRNAQNHEFQQIQTEKSQAAQALIALNSENAVLNYHTPTEVKVYADQALSALRSEARSAGWSPALEEVKTKELMSKLYAGVFENHFRDGNIDAAQKVLDDNRDWITGSMEAKLRNDLRVKALDVAVEKESDIIFAQHKDDYEAAMKAVKDTASGDKRTMMERRVDTLFNMQRKAEAEQENNLYNQGYMSIRSAGNRNAAEKAAMQFTDLDVRVKLFNVVDHLYPIDRSASSGKVKLTDEQKLLMKLGAALTENTAFDEMKTDVIKNPDRYETRAAVFAAGIKQGIVDEKKLEELWALKQGDGVYGEITNDKVARVLPAGATYAALGIEPPTKKQKNSRIRPEDIPPEIMTAVWDQAKASGKIPSADELRQTVATLLTSGTVQEPGLLWGTNPVKKRYYEAMAEGKAEEFKPADVMDADNKAELSAAISALQKRAGQQIDLSDDKINAVSRSLLAVEVGAPTEVPHTEAMSKFLSWAKKKNTISLRDPVTGIVKNVILSKPLLQQPETWDKLLKEYTQQIGGK